MNPPKHIPRREIRQDLPLQAAMLLALAVGGFHARLAGLEPMRVLCALVLLIPVSLVGARGLFVLLRANHFRSRPAQIVRVDQGGSALYGGLLLSLALSSPLLAWLELPYAVFADVAAVAGLAALIPARLGCARRGCCAGRETRRGERFPYPLAEAALAAALLLLALVLQNRLSSPGALALILLGGYAAGRLALDARRADRGPLWAGLSANQWISLALLASCVAGSSLGFVREAPTIVSAANAVSTPLRLASLGLLFVPVLQLSRFMGCSIYLKEQPAFALDLGLRFPTPPAAGAIVATMRFVELTSMDEVADSPFELELEGTTPGGFEFRREIQLGQGSYRVTCDVLLDGSLLRSGTCDGELNGADLSVFFLANEGDEEDALTSTQCFEPSPTA